VQDLTPEGGQAGGTSIDPVTRWAYHQAVTAIEPRPEDETRLESGSDEETPEVPAWEESLLEATAHTFVRKWGTSSSPALFICDDGGQYVVKGVQAGRMIVNDNLAARIGRRIGAPVPDVAIVHVPSELVALEPELSYFTPGPSHGSRFISNTHDGTVQHTATNRARFAILAILFGLVVASDHQFLYENEPPHLVYSADHGHFFPAGPGWTADSLHAADPASPDLFLTNTAGLDISDLQAAATGLSELDDSFLKMVTSQVPDTWGLALAERHALVTFLGSRRDSLLEWSKPIVPETSETGDTR
jgi:hypothetical protein